MTEGIIKEVLDKAIKSYNETSHFTYYGNSIAWSIENIKSELIEKIKQNIVVDSFDKELDCVLLSDLIGDNQE